MYRSFAQVVIEEIAPHYVESILFPNPLDWRLPYFLKREGYQILSAHQNHSVFLFARGFVENNRTRLTSSDKKLFLTAEPMKDFPPVFRLPFLSTSQMGLLAAWAERIDGVADDLQRSLLWWVFYRVMFYWYYQQGKPLLAVKQIAEHYIREANRLVFNNGRANLALWSSSSEVFPLFSGEMVCFILEEGFRPHPVREAFQAILHRTMSKYYPAHQPGEFIPERWSRFQDVPVWCFHITSSVRFLKQVDKSLGEFKRRKKTISLYTPKDKKGSFVVLGW